MPAILVLVDARRLQLCLIVLGWAVLAYIATWGVMTDDLPWNRKALLGLGAISLAGVLTVVAVRLWRGFIETDTSVSGSADPRSPLGTMRTWRRARYFLRFLISTGVLGVLAYVLKGDMHDVSLLGSLAGAAIFSALGVGLMAVMDWRDGR